MVDMAESGSQSQLPHASSESLQPEAELELEPGAKASSQSQEPNPEHGSQSQLPEPKAPPWGPPKDLSWADFSIFLLPKANCDWEVLLPVVRESEDHIGIHIQEI